MAEAIIENGRLCSPTVGTWFPDVASGVLAVPHQRIGRVLQAGRWVDILSPGNIGGVFVPCAAEGNWVSRGVPLFEIRQEISGTEEWAEEPADRGIHDGCPQDCVVIASDTDGTVYLRPDPQAAPYVLESAKCAAKETLALVEVMKTFSPVRAPSDGQIESIRVADGDSVQSGDALFWFRPN